MSSGGLKTGFTGNNSSYVLYDLYICREELKLQQMQLDVLLLTQHIAYNEEIKHTQTDEQTQQSCSQAWEPG